ncbi:BQ5605_C004g02806 [Microbotryum silenes-dioicae]|uniref:BQ5605_C004g02806 protein n=1 Tax=Microbotryum silenes-dioicae TaxID=796604 RepID=A0A2X0PAX3_9BASI|nr:BQ5605_C004g02806 [Microbotryum silenes-dioicae]
MRFQIDPRRDRHLSVGSEGNKNIWPGIKYVTELEHRPTAPRPVAT